MYIESIKKRKTTEELLEFGIINIDKPSNPTSFDVSDFVRKKLGLKKTSHFGTLDPKVTGVLPIALSRACKLTGFFLGEDKECVGIMRLHEDISVEAVEKVIKDKFMGKIKQTPPKKSRVKRQEREREIISFEILEKNGKDFVFLAEVQGGTYIRKLISDLGDYIKIGAHMLEMKRVRAGIIGESGIFFASKKHRAGIIGESGIFFASKKHRAGIIGESGIFFASKKHRAGIIGESGIFFASKKHRAGIIGESGIFFASKKHRAGIIGESGIFFASKKH